MPVNLGVECWVYTERRFVLVRRRPSADDPSPSLGPFTGPVEDGEMPDEAVLRLLEQEMPYLAETQIDHVAAGVEVPVAAGMTGHVDVWFADWQRTEEPAFPRIGGLGYDMEALKLPHEVPAMLSQDRYRRTWELVREHQLARADGDPGVGPSQGAGLAAQNRELRRLLARHQFAGLTPFGSSGGCPECSGAVPPLGTGHHPGCAIAVALAQ